MGQENVEAFAQRGFEPVEEGGIQQTHLEEVAQVRPVLVSKGGQFQADERIKGDDAESVRRFGVGHIRRSHRTVRAHFLAECASDWMRRGKGSEGVIRSG